MLLVASILLFPGHIQVYDAGVDFLMNTAICRKVRMKNWRAHTDTHTLAGKGAWPGIFDQPEYHFTYR